MRGDKSLDVLEGERKREREIEVSNQRMHNKASNEAGMSIYPASVA